MRPCPHRSSVRSLWHRILQQTLWIQLPVFPSPSLLECQVCSSTRQQSAQGRSILPLGIHHNWPKPVMAFSFPFTYNGLRMKGAQSIIRKISWGLLKRFSSLIKEKVIWEQNPFFLLVLLDEGVMLRAVAAILWPRGESQENCSLADQELKYH